MQSAKLAGHRPRPPSRTGVSVFPLFLSFSPLFNSSRSGVAAGARNLPSSRLERMRGIRKGEVFASNSIGPAQPDRWIARASYDGL